MDDIIRQRWMKSGDKCTRTFLSTFRRKSTEIELFELLNQDGAVLKDWEDIVEEVIHHFTLVFASCQHGDPQQQFDFLLGIRMLKSQLPPVKDLRSCPP